MYRIKLASGDETTFHSIDELTTALHNGQVTDEALIYHQRADRWLTITNHPHYQIALSRTSTAVPQQDGSKRQVVTAVRPPEGMPHPAPAGAQTVTRPEVQRKLSIPAPRKPDTGPLRAHENVLEGVQIPRTTALPIRHTPAPAPKVPDLGDGLDLLEPESDRPVADKKASDTPQTDKLLEMLGPTPKVESASLPHLPKLADVEILDLNASPSKVEPARVPEHHHSVAAHPVTHAQHHVEVPHVTYRPRKSPKLIGMGAAAVLVLSTGIFIWKPWAKQAVIPGESATVASTAGLPRTDAFGGAAPAADSGATSAPVKSPTQPADSARATRAQADSGPSIVRVAAPRNMSVRVPTGNLSAVAETRNDVSATVLVQHYNAAYTDAKAELELRMLQIGFTQMFLKSRLTTGAGVQDTRRLIASATSAIRQYRTAENQIERAYQDTMGVAGRNLGWTPRDLGTWNAKPLQKEAPETLRLTNLLLSQMDSVLSLLAEQDGNYQISGETIVFDDSEAARQYGMLRSWINQQADTYTGSGDALPVTLRQVVKAIGGTRLPQERRR
jgi:hypothetical protein